MIGKLLSGLFDLIIGLVNVLLTPIDLAIASFLPDLSTALNSIASFFDYLTTIVGYAIDASGLTDVSLALIVSYWVFVLSGSLSINLFKSAIRWYKALKP